ncbi:DNA polymerase III subunit delta [Botrimarina sp.]|uniref:DNA polymerase III subunit delta n=1 Tax=Botrimarina sp. TaxID=2795802 RepID=UPI0032EE4D78
MATRSETGLAYLLSPTEPPGAMVAISGDDQFVRREVLKALRGVLCAGPDDLDWRVFDGATADWRDVADGVAARSLFGGGRPVAVVEEADPFVTRYRDQLEAFATSKPAGVVVIDLKSLPASTRLAKAIGEHGLLVACKSPDRGAEAARHRRDAGKWLTKRAAEAHRVRVTGEAIDALLDLLPMDLGVVDQEVARLALLAGDGAAIDANLVRDNVGGWRVRTAWELVDAAADGRIAEAIAQLDRLLLAGEQPIGVLAQLGSTLRKFAAAAAHVDAAERAGGKPSLPAALRAAGFAPFKLADAERQLRRIGRRRASQLSEWVLQADRAMKGHNSAPARARVELERLLFRLANETPRP